MKVSDMFRGLITGPESTGKSELSQALALHYGGKAISEYAREYVEKLNRSCTYEDVEHIARWQQNTYIETQRSGAYVFFDTWLIITRVWFEVVFKKVPAWLDEQIDKADFDLVFYRNVCDFYRGYFTSTHDCHTNLICYWDMCF